MTTPEQRQQMAAAIVDFEARRDAAGHLMVYHPPTGDGGGAYEVAGINARYNRSTAKTLAGLIGQRRFDEAERLATDFIARNTDCAASWTDVPAVESYLRDCVFNRGATGGARILQRALGVEVDGKVGPQTRAAVTVAAPADLLARLRTAREQYERDVAHRDEHSKFWNGLVARWDKAITVAQRFPMTPAPTSAIEPMAALLVDGRRFPTNDGSASARSRIRPPPTMSRGAIFPLAPISLRWSPTGSGKPCSAATNMCRHRNLEIEKLFAFSEAGSATISSRSRFPSCARRSAARRRPRSDSTVWRRAQPSVAVEERMGVRPPACSTVFSPSAAASWPVSSAAAAAC